MLVSNTELNVHDGKLQFQLLEMKEVKCGGLVW